MPSVLGMLMDDAILTLTEQGLEVGECLQVYNNVYGEGYVCYQSVSYGSDVTKGTKVDIQVSKGPEPEVEDKYSFQADILAPTPAEDPEFKSGTEVKITIAKKDGAVLFETTTTSFPVPVNMTSISGSDGGILKMSYTIKKQPTDPETGLPNMTVPPESEDREILREIEFVKEEDD